MAANCTNLPKQINNGAASMGTFRTGGGPPTSLGYHHNTLTRTTKIGISSLGIGAGTGGGASVGGLTMAEVKERMATIDGSSQRVRLVRLTRPQSYAHGHFNGGGNFGFSIRGGLEYGTGFFVSAVEKNSEADQQGLRVGDQIIRVNGYQVDDAVHRELAQFVSCQERLVLKVRSVGILPVKERSADPLTWHVVTISTNSGPSSLPNILHPVNGAKKKHPHRSELERTSCSSSSNSSTGSSGTLEEIPGGRDIKVVVSVAPRTKLGCGICKGPDWKPGIFVQFTKEGGVAREAGLRPGDQIMSCNGREFADITFAEAVSIMKASQVLELVVRPGAGIDMFPGESSGYNSSASSVNGDQSPCWGDSTAKRLSIVREESISKDRRSGLQRADKVGPKTAGGHRRNNTTIIEFSENGTVVNSSLISQDGAGGKKEMESKEGSKKLADICFVSKQSETKTVIVEVHRSASTNSIATGSPTSSSSGVSTVSSSGSTSHIPPPPPLFADKIPPPPPPSSGLSSGYSTTNSAKSGGLGTQHQQRSPSSVSLADSSASSGIDCGSSNNGDGIGGLGSAISEELKRRAQKKGSLLSSTAQEPAAALTELENRLKEKRFRPPVNSGSDAARHSALMDEFRAVHKRMFKNGFDNAEIKKAPSQDKLPIEVRPPGATTTSSGSTPSCNSSTQGGKGTMGRVAASELAKANGDIAELESIESFQLNSPTPTPVRPPSYYFCPQNTGPPTMKKSQKPIAVTISEYIGVGGCIGGNDEIAPDLPKKIGNLKYELEKTLSLSNLRQRSESREDLVERIQIGSQLDQGTRLSRSSSAVTTVSNGNRITIAISNGADKK